MKNLNCHSRTVERSRFVKEYRGVAIITKVPIAIIAKYCAHKAESHTFRIVLVLSLVFGQFSREGPGNEASKSDLVYRTTVSRPVSSPTLREAGFFSEPRRLRLSSDPRLPLLLPLAAPSSSFYDPPLPFSVSPLFLHRRSRADSRLRSAREISLLYRAKSPLG